MASTVANPTNAPPRVGQALPFIRKETKKSSASAEAKKDAFNTGKEYVDEGAPLLTGEAEAAKAAQKPAFAIVHRLVTPSTQADMDALAHPDETSQTQIRYLKEAVVMDVDAKLIISSIDQMKRGVFREAHYPTLLDYMKSDHYKRLREARIVAEKLVGVAKSTRLRESATIAGVRLNPRLVRALNAADSRIMKHLTQSGFMREISRLQESIGGKKLKEQGFPGDVGDWGQPTTTAGQIGANWDGGYSFGLGGREPDFIPLLAGPYNKQLYYFDYLDMHSKSFECYNHNPIAKRIVKVLTQFTLGKGVKLTVMRAVRRSEEKQIPSTDSQNLKQIAAQLQQQKPTDYKAKAQEVLDTHWVKNQLHIRSKQIFKDLLVFGENFIRYFDAPWGLKMREVDPSVVWEVVTDPDDAENEMYIHCQYPTKYQWFVDLPIPTIKFIIRQVPSILYYHMKINCTAGEVRGRSELFAILGWLKRLKEYASDRVTTAKVANLFIMDVAVEGDATTVAQVQSQFSTPPTPGSFFIHNKAAELKGVSTEVAEYASQNDWEMFMTIIAMGAGISQEYLGMTTAGGKAGALVGTEPDIKTFEDYQEMMEAFFLQDAQRVFTRAKERKEIPDDLTVVVEVTYPALAEENRSEKLKDMAFGESMSWFSHRRVASAAAKELQYTSYDYDQEQQQIAEEDAMKEFLINTAYQQVTKGVDSLQQKAASKGNGSGGTSSGSSGKGASGMGMGKLPGAGSSKQSESEFEEADDSEDEITPTTAPGTSTYSGGISGQAVTHNASVGADGKRDPWAGKDPRDMATGIKREAANLRYERRGVGRREDRIETPDKIRNQRSMDRGNLLTKAKRAAKRGNLNKEARQRFPRETEEHGMKGQKWGERKPNSNKRELTEKVLVGKKDLTGYQYEERHPRTGQRLGTFATILGSGGPEPDSWIVKTSDGRILSRGVTRQNLYLTTPEYQRSIGAKEAMEPFKPQDGDRLQHPRVETVPEHQGHPRGSGKRMSPSGFGGNKREKL